MAAVSDLNARERIIETAGSLLRSRGYAAASLRDIVDQAGAPWGSLQHYFPGGKTQIAVEAIQAGSARVGAFIDSAFTSNDTSQDALAWFFDRSLQLMIDTDYEFGCPIATVALERAVMRDEIAAACAATLSDWTARFAAGFRAAGMPDDRAQRLAVITLSQYEGAMLITRVARDPAPFVSASLLLQELATG